MITIAYEENYGMLDRLFYAGLDSEKRPMWVKLTPGEMIMVSTNYEKGLGKLYYKHLCMEGEEVPSYLVARILGLSFDDKKYRSRNMMDHLMRMKDLNLKWKKDPLEMVFTIYDECKEDKECYLLRVDDDKDFTLVDETDFESLHELELALSTYMYFLRTYTEIPVTKMKLRAPKRLITSWKKSKLMGFSDYSAFENEPDY